MSGDVGKAPDSRRNRCGAEVVGLVPKAAVTGASDRSGRVDVSNAA